MNLKKLVLLLTLFTGIFACECFDGGTEWNIDRFEVSILDKDENLPLGGVIEGDSVKLSLEFEAEFVENYSNPFNGLMASAYATSCTFPGDDGLEDQVLDFTVTSSSAFNEIPAGASLNDLLVVNGNQTIPRWIMNSEFWKFRYTRFVELFFKEKPEPGTSHIFTVKFVLKSGKVIEQQTDEITWN